jgi:gliding motility-associated-like protein
VSKSYTITVNPKPVANAISNVLTCAGTSVSSISLSASSPNSGTGTSFSWSGNNNSAIGLSVSSGTTSPIPSFTATNSTNNLISSTITVTPTYQGCVGNPINFNIDVTPISLGGTLSGDAQICSGSASGLLTLAGYRGAILNWESSLTGTAPWTSIANTTSTFQSGGLTQTTYYRVAVQNPGCSTVYSNIVIITVNNTPSITGTLSSCIGSTSQLSGNIPASSNAWQSSNPGIATISNTGLVTGISSGTSIITFTNANGCLTTVNFVVNPQPLVVTNNPAPICNPNTINLTVPTVTAGSSSNLTFSYFLNAGASTPLTSPNSVSTSGTYYIKGTDSNGCSNINSVTVLINSLPTITVTGNNSICLNQSTTLTASGANSYVWNGGIGSTPSVSVTPSNTTTYTVNGTDNNGCVGIGTYNVNVKALPIVNAGTDKNICAGSMVTLSGSGTGVTTFTWDNAISDGVAFQPASTTTYTVTGLGTNGCFNTDSVLVTVNALPSAPQMIVTQPTCTSATGNIQFSGLPTTGSWTINPGSYNGSGATYSLNSQSPGSYTFTVKDANQCTSSSSTAIINTAPITPSAPGIGTVTQPNCTNPTGSVILSGLPTGTWTITKSPGGETYTNTGNTYTVTNLTTGTYTFTVSNGTCNSNASTNVVINATPSVSAPIVGLMVQPTCFVATGSVTLSGLPSGSWTLTRLPSNINFTSTGLNTTISGLTTGIYNYTVTDANGCVSSISNNVTINTQPATPIAPIANAQSFLVSDNAAVSNLVIASAGTPTWYSSASGGTAINSATLLTTGIYYASQTINGCESSNRTAVNVSVFPNSIGGAVSGSTTVCSGTNSTTLTLSGYTGNIIKWQRSTIADFSANVTDINNLNATYTATNINTPTYFRAVVQSGTAPLEYSSPAFIDINSQSIGGTLSTSTSICRGETSGLLTVSGFNGNIIRWEQSDNYGATWTTISNTTNTYTSGPLTTTTQYRVIVKNGVCSETQSSVVTITVKATPVVTDISNQEVCFGETRTFGDAFIGGHTYSWTSDLGYSSTLPQVSITFNQVVTQNYTYTITNTSTGCFAQDQFQLIVNPLPNPVVVPDTSICVGNSIAIGGNSTIGSTYSWSSNPTGFTSTNSNPTVNPVVTTTYTVEETVTATGCIKTNQVTITVQPEPVITIVGAPQFNVCETTTQIQLQSTITNYTTSSIVWSKVIGSGTFDFTNIANPKYSPSFADITFGSVKLKLTITGIGACSQSYSEEVVIIIDKKPIANAGLDVITCGTNPVQINATGTLYASNLVWTLPTGITGTLDLSNPYIPVYTPSVGDQNYVGPIVISLTATSNTTCPSSSDTVSALITPAPKVDAGPPAVTICEGANYIVPFNAMAAQNIVNSTILWTNGTGDGTIVGANSLTPTYIPGNGDIINGSVTLTLSAAGNNPCSTPATDNIVINIVKNPIVNAGPDKTVCQGSINVNATIQNAGAILWTVQNGSGSFVDPTAISPIYIPSLSDLNTTVTFTVTVTPINNCGPTVSDSVLYTINAAPSVVAGGNATICQSNSTYQLQATATNTITWTSTGSGSFDNIHNEDPIYTLSPNDIVAGSVTFTITGTQTGCSNVTDTMVLTIQKNPTANAGPAQVICQGDIVVLPGSATNSSGYNWIRNGGAGTFINTNTTNPTYMSQPTESGTIYLTLIANAIAPCTVSASSNTTITIIPKATADAGVDAQICEGGSYQITTASASNNIGVQWSTNGDGTFTGGSTISPTYTPGPSDNNNGSVTLTLVATKNFPCNANAVDEMTLIINKIPTITVINPNVDLCVGDPSYVVTGVVPSHYDTLTWTRSGSGTFAPNNGVIAPTYFPSASDYTLGTVTLTLTASRNPLNCNSSTSNTITLHFISPPTADAGPANATICEESSYVTIGTDATNESNVTWSTTGTGTFTSATTLTATYTPSAADFNLGFVDLTLMANPLNPCTAPATDVIRLFLQKLPVITLTASDAICVTQNSYGIGGTTVTDYDTNSIVWTTTGTGTFSPSGNPLNPIYNPSNADLASASVTLTLTVNSITPCVVPVSSSLVLSFQKVPVANAGFNITRCAIPFQITDATANLATVSNLVWSTSGTGTFDFTNVIDPIYTPSAADILSVNPIRLTLTANPIAPCAVPLVSFIDVILIKTPSITVVTPQPTICEDETNVLVNGTVVQNAASYNWTSTTGTGTGISNETSLTPIVTPSLTDINNNYIDLTITAIPDAPCSTTVTKKVRIPIQKKPSVSAGAAQTICEGNVITTTDALSSNVTNLTWNNNGGDGTFSTSNLNTVTEYTPGPIEIANGSVTLTVTADAIAPCVGTVTATVVHLITKNPVITVNPTQVTICETGTYQVPLSQVTVVNPSSIATIQWTTTNGSLTGSNTFTPTYTPSAADINAGFANLVLTVTPIAPCATPIVKTIRVNITKKATIDATQANYTFCENTPKQLSAVFNHHNPATISWAIVSGSGTLSGINTATPIFTPDTSSDTVIIEVSVNSNAPCTEVTTQQFTLDVIKKPIVTFTNTTDIICNTQTSYALNATTIAATVTNTTTNTTYLWTTTGTGTFASNTALVTTYNFSAADLLLNTITLRLTAQSDALCAMTDFEEIVITIKPAPIVTTTPNETICEGTVFTAIANATNENTVLWTTSGTSNGTFTSENAEIAEYTPGSNDINGFTLLFTAFGDPVCSVATATKTVTIQKRPILDAGVENRNNCSSEPFQLTGVTGQNNGTITWTSNSSSGVNSGTFSNASVLNPIYNPSAAEIAAGTPITLTVTSQSIAPCTGTVTDFVILNLTPTQVVNAGVNQTICENETVSLNGSASNSTSYNWTTSGTGTFSNVNSLTTNYTPSTADILSNTVTLTLHATSNSTCPDATDSTVITIRKNPTANAGIAATICEGSNYTLSLGEATATNYTSLVWTATGPGALDVTKIDTLTPTYIPASGQTGTVTLTLTATGYAECAQDAVSVKTITIVPSPFVSVISSKTICEGTTLTISNTDASATNYSSLQWSSSNGLGTFTPNNATATTYTPATGQTGNVTLSLTASSPNGACPSSVGNILLNIIPKPIVEAGTNGTICQNGTYTVTGADVQNASLYSWSVSGPAIIVPGTENTLNPEIDPNDNASGTITVTLTATGTGICPVTVTDNLTIQINPAPTVSAGTDGFLCEGTGSFQLNGNVTSTTNYSWTTTGGGTIQLTANPLAPLYIPSVSDFNTSTGVNVITITLNATTTNGCSAANASMQLTLYAKPKIYAGNDLISCGNDYSVSLLGARVYNYNSGYTISWTSSGNGTFDYTGSNGGINPTYIFGTNDTSSVTLTMSALPNSNCPQVAVTDAMTITINQNPAISTTSNVISMCGETFTLPDLVTVSNSNNLLWTNITGVSGTPGTLTNETTETPNFTPSINEIANGFVLLKLTATPISGCSLPATTTIRVNLQPKAKINLVPSVSTNITACQGEVITINNIASVEDYSTFLWTENGTGSIVPSTLNTLNPEYTPGINETGVVSFTLQATNISPCTGLVSQIVTVTIAPQPTVNAGPDVTICENTPIALNTATTTNSNSIVWLSSENSNGTSSPGYTGGSFSNINILQPIYTPSQDDINLGYVYLTVRAANTSCNSLVTDVIKVTITPQITVAAGSNATICEGSAFTLAEASHTNAVGYTWTSSQNSNLTSIGTYVTGSFNSNSILNPVYTPSLDDINLGYVYLTITATGGTNCPTATSQMKLTIVKKPTVSTTDVQMCMNTPQISLNGSATNYQSLNWSIYSGPGSISTNPIDPLHPTFISGISGLNTVQTTIVRLYAEPIPGCPQFTAVYDDLVITIQPLPSVEAGSNGAVCYVAGQPIVPFAITGTTVTNASSQSWSSSGVGVFNTGTPVTYQSFSTICATETLTLTANGIGACSTSTVSDNINLTINCAVPSLGTITSNATATVCQGTTATYTIPVNTAIQTYTWSVPTGSTIQSGQGTNSITVLFGAISGNVSVTGTNGCGSAIATTPITVNTLPTGVSIAGPQTVCAGATNLVYTASTIPNATSYVWTLPNGSTIITATNTITIAIGVNEASGNLSVAGNNACGLGSSSSAFPITINPKPVLTSTLNPAAICSETVFNYIPTTATIGSTFSWTRAVQPGISNAAASGNGAISETLINTTNADVTVAYQITITTPQGCTNSQFISFTLYPAPSLTSNPTPSAICTGSTFNYTPTSSTVGTILWQRNATSGILEAASNGSGIINEVLTNTTNLPITVSYLVTLPATTNGCTNATQITVQVNVNPNNTVTTASTTPTVCINSVVTPITHTTSGATGIAIASGLPTGVTASWVANTITISGTPTVSGTFNYTIPLIGGCSSINATGSITVNPNNTVTVASSTPTLCINTTLTPITHTTTGATGIGTATGLPTGVTASWLANTITIGGTPAASGTFNYNIPLTGGCGGAATGTITVIPSNTVTPAVSTPTLCINTTLTPITHNTIGATGIGTVSGLPAGVTATWAANTITISGAPSVSGTFNYNILLTGGCGSVNATGSIIVNPDNTVVSTTSSQTVCINTILPSITHTTTGASGIGLATGLPTGITASWAGNIITISGTPTASGIFNYSIPLTGGCNTVFATGTITVNPNNTVTPSSGPQTVCINTILTTITHNTTGATGIGSATGLPTGVTASWAANTITISGAPTTIGTFNYSIPLTGGCSTINATGTIIVNPDNTVSSASSAQTLCINTILTPITHTTTGATGIGTVTGLPSGVSASWLANTITISGAPTTAGTFNYSIPLTGGCNTLFATGSIIVNPNNTVTPSSGPQTLCINSALATISHITTGATGIGTATGLPTGVTASWVANTITISGTPAASGTFNYNIPLTGGCGGAATGTITVIPSNTVTPAVSTPTLCINTTLTPITHNTTGATGIGTASGLPAGVTASWAANTITISGAPTASGTFNYSIPLTGGCGLVNTTGSIIVNPDNTVVSTTSNQTVCISTVLTPITHNTTGATGIGAATSLPPGVSASWAGNIITISGTPTASGIFNYSIPLTGGCNTVFATGTITVNPNNTVTLVPLPQTLCINTALTPITYTTTGATGIGIATGLPTGVTASWSANTITITGAPTAIGTFNYSIPLTGGCSTINATGTIIVNPDNTVSSASSSEILCINTILPTITHTTTGATGIGTATGLPNGVSASWLANTITISGAPTTVGVFNYSIPLTGGCNTLFATGSIVVNPNNTITTTSSTATLCINTSLTPINYTTTGATGIGTATGLPTGVAASWIANTITVSGTPSASGTFNYSIPLTGGCGGVALGTITVTPNNTVSPASATPTLCINTVLPAFVHTTTGATGIGTASGLPAGVTASWAANTITISGAPTASGTFNYSIPLTGGCGSVNATGSIIVNPDNTIVSTTSNQSLCINTTLSPITHTTTGATGIGVATGLPTGITASWAGNIITLSGTPTVIGIYNYSIPLTGGCNTVFATGTITVNPVPVVNITNPAPACLPATVDITTTTTGSTPGLSYTYWNNSAATIALVNPSSVSISGTYYIKGTNSFGCSTISPVVVNINPSPTATITGQNSFNICQNDAQPQITFTASNGTAPYTFTYQVISNGTTGPTLTVTTLGTSASSTISFPTGIAGNHTITLLSVQDSSAALCNSTNITLPNTAYVTVQQIGTITPNNQAVVSQTVCQTTPITPIVFTIGGAATNAFATNLPNGLSGSYVSGIFTISGTPLVTGVFNYVVHTSGSNCNSTYPGTITVNSNDNISILPPALVNQTVCNNISIQPIVYSLGGGATGGIVTFTPSQPVGITWNIVNNVITISGASNTIGTFTYTVQSFGICGQSTATGNITINPSSTISLVSGNPNTTVCIGSSLPPIQYSITPATATMVVTGLPTGVTFNAATGIITGTPTQSGTFPYSITSTTTCGNTLTGTITVNPLQSIGYLSGNTSQVACQNTPIDPINFLVSGGVNTVSFTPALPAGINFNIASGILTVSGTPTSPTSVASNYTITTQGTCGPQASYSITFDIRPEATITLTAGSGSINQSVCQSAAITPISFTIGGGATGIITPTLPNGLSLSYNAGTGVYTIQGNPLVNGVFNFPITTTGCPKTLFVTISNVNTSVGIVLTSPVGTDNQTLCQTVFNSPIQPIIYNVIGATSIVANGLPPGVTAVFSVTTGQLIISGTPLVSGVFNYTVTSQPCSIVKAGVIRVSTPISVTNEIVTNVSCSNINDGAISVTIVGGVSFNGLYAIHWSGPNGFQQNQTTITGLEAGTYVLTGTDAIGCPIPTMTYTVLPAQPINIALQSSTNVSCNGTLGCANFNITGGSGIYTLFTLQYLDPGSQTLVTVTPANNNYYNICNLQAGLYYLTVKDSNNCTTIPYLFTIYDYSALSIENVTMDDNLCQDDPGKIRIKVNSLDPNLTFYFNNILVPSVDLGNNIYELSINTPTPSNGVIKVKNSQNCWVTIPISTTIITPDFEFTSNDFENYGYFSVNQSIQFTHLVNMAAIPAEYDYIVWDFGDNTPFKVFYNPEDLLPNGFGENFETAFHTYTANGIYEITLTVYNRFGCSRKITKIIKVGTGATIMLPTIFTPNNDGINDYFRPSTIGLKKVSMFIYDKWGNLVYEFSSDVADLNANWGWDGIEKGKTEPINNDYRYYIIGTTINDINEEKEGRFLLVK